jgi:hypothetical protein
LSLDGIDAAGYNHSRKRNTNARQQVSDQPNVLDSSSCVHTDKPINVKGSMKKNGKLEVGGFELFKHLLHGEAIRGIVRPCSTILY